MGWISYPHSGLLCEQLGAGADRVQQHLCDHLEWRVTKCILMRV